MDQEEQTLRCPTQNQWAGKIPFCFKYFKLGFYICKLEQSPLTHLKFSFPVFIKCLSCPFQWSLTQDLHKKGDNERSGISSWYTKSSINPVEPLLFFPKPGSKGSMTKHSLSQWNTWSLLFFHSILTVIKSLQITVPAYLNHKYFIWLHPSKSTHCSTISTSGGNQSHSFHNPSLNIHPHMLIIEFYPQRTSLISLKPGRMRRWSSVI